MKKLCPSIDHLFFGFTITDFEACVTKPQCLRRHYWRPRQHQISQSLDPNHHWNRWIHVRDRHQTLVRIACWPPADDVFLRIVDQLDRFPRPPSRCHCNGKLNLAKFVNFKIFLNFTIAFLISRFYEFREFCEFLCTYTISLVWGEPWPPGPRDRLRLSCALRSAENSKQNVRKKYSKSKKQD